MTEMKCRALIFYVTFSYSLAIRAILADRFYPYGLDANDTCLCSPEHRQTINNGTVYVSRPIRFSSPVSFGQGHRSPWVAQVMTNGIIRFGEGRAEVTGSPDLIFSFERKQNIIAPLWGDFRPTEGKVFYHLYEKCPTDGLGGWSENSTATARILQRAERDVNRHFNMSGFDAISALVATWVDVIPYGNKTDSETFTFQAIFITGWKDASIQGDVSSYVIFLYDLGETSDSCFHGNRINIGVAGAEVKVMFDSNSSSVSVRGFIKDNSGVVTYHTGNSNIPPAGCHRYLCKHADLLSSDTYRREQYQLVPCPCTLDRLGFPWQLLEKRGENRNIHCYAINTEGKGRFLPANTRNKLCCYRVPDQSCHDDLHLKQSQSCYIQQSAESGHVLVSDLWPATRHVEDNMAAQRLCCLNSSYTMCNKFFDLFPAQECSSDVDFVTAYVFGDPHITTFDKLSYSMNGWGEFTLMNVTTQDFVLQVRTGRARTPYGTFVNATMLTGVAGSEGNHSHFQAVLDSSGTGMILHVNGQNVTDDFYKKDDFNWTPNNAVSVWRECGQNKTFVLAMFPSGVTVKINTALQNLELEIQATKFLMNKTVGLLGNFNNISEDDLSPTRGFTISTPIDWRDSKFYQTYIQNWRVNQTHSVFKYGDKEDLSSLQDFRPTFAEDLKLVKALYVCGSRDELCSFDYLVTNDKMFAQNTHNFRSYHSNRDDKLRNNPPTLSLKDKDVLVDGRWIVTHGLVEQLELATSDRDGHQVTVSWVDGPSEARRVTNLTLQYVPDVQVPTRIGLRSRDRQGAYSPVLYIPVSLCPQCGTRGQCDVNGTMEDTFYDGYFQVLRCVCSPAYTGVNCESPINPCDTRPCSWGQVCQPVSHQADNDTILDTNPRYTCGACPENYENVLGKCVAVVQDGCPTTIATTATTAPGNPVTSLPVCQEGFHLDKDSLNCADIDECASRETNGCSYLDGCVNTIGSFTCSCMDGFYLERDGRACVEIIRSGTGEMKESKAEHVNLIIYLSLGVSLFVLLCVAVMLAVKLWITRHHVKGNNRAKSPDPKEKTTRVKRAKVSPHTKVENPYYSEIQERALSQVLPHNEDVYAHIKKPVKGVFNPPQVKTQPNFYVRDWGHVQENFYHEIPEVKGKLPYDRDTLLEY